MNDESSSSSPWNVRNALWLTLGFSCILLLVFLVWGAGDVFVSTAVVLVVLASAGQWIMVRTWKRRLLESGDDS